MDRTEKQFVDFAASLKFSDLSPAAIHAVKVRYIDTFGVALAAQQAPTVKAARTLTAPVRSGPQARIFGTLETVTPDMAAFVNGAMARYLDMNDAYTRDQADGQWFFTITRGRGTMPYYRDALSREERWHVINYMRSTFGPE